MTEEVKPGEGEQGKENQVTEPVTYTEIEQKALDQGWVPQDQWDGDPEAWRPAKEFVERGEIFKSLHSTKRELNQTRAALSAQMQHHRYVFEKAYQKALAELRQEKRQAIRSQDFEAVEAVEGKIEQLQEEHQQEAAQFQQVQQVAQQQNVAPEFQAFLDKNPWYATDRDLNIEADLIGRRFLEVEGGSKANLFEHVEKEIKRRHPEKFGGAPSKPQKQAAPNAVATPTRSKAGPKAESINDVPEGMRDVVKNFCQSTGMSEADYIKQLKQIGAF